MSLRAFRSGCNVLATIKDGKKYGMVCAWATMIDYDKIGMLVGGQSVTGQILGPGTFVGVSALAEGQKDIALKLGESHSNNGDKFDGIETEANGSALLISGAKCKMICEVSKIANLIDPNDKFVVMTVLTHTSEKDKEFLSLEEVYPED